MVTDIAEFLLQVGGSSFFRMKNSQREVVKSSSFPNERFIKIGILPTETVIDVGDIELEIVFFRKEKESVKQAQAVSTAGNSDDEVFLFLPQRMGGNGILDTF